MLLIKKSLFYFIFLLISLPLYSQRTLLAGAQLDFGMPVNNFAMQRNILGSHIFSYHLAGALSLQLRMWDRIGIEAGISQHSEHWRIKDKDFKKRHPGFKVDLRNKNNYYSYFANLQLLQKISYFTFIYVQGGYSINMVGSGSFSQSRIFVRGNETVHATSVYKPQNTSITTGIGIQKILGIQYKHMISFGLTFNLGRENLLEGSYLVEKSGTTVSEDKYFSRGSFIGVNAKYCLILAHRDKKIKPPKEPKPKDRPVVTIPPVIVPPKDTLPKIIEGRELTVTHKITVTKKTVIVKVWDHQKIDGDRISLNVNGKWVLMNYTLDRKQKVIELELNEGENIFVLHALNLGKYEPNTAAIIIDDGTKENKIILESTLKTSGTIQITCNP